MLPLKPFDVFSREEINEVILMVYNVLGWAVNSDSNILSLDDKQFTWFRDDKEVGNFRIDRLKPSISFRDALETIINRDEFIRKSVSQISATEREFILAITRQE
jgi:hypothetical protein